MQVKNETKLGGAKYRFGNAFTHFCTNFLCTRCVVRKDGMTCWWDKDYTDWLKECPLMGFECKIGDYVAKPLAGRKSIPGIVCGVTHEEMSIVITREKRVDISMVPASPIKEDLDKIIRGQDVISVSDDGFLNIDLFSLSE